MAPLRKPDDPSAKYVRATEVKRRLRIEDNTMQRLIREGKLPAPFKLGYRSVRFDRAEAEPMIRALEAAAREQKEQAAFLAGDYPELAAKRPKY